VATATTNGFGPAGLPSAGRRFDTTGHYIRNGQDDDRAVDPPPQSASARAYLRSSLPEIYLQDDFGLRFLGALETVLDPVVGMLDCLPAQLDPELAPDDVLRLIAAWLSVRLDKGWPEAQKRALVREAPQLGRRHGTREGLELGLRIAFPDLELRVEDNGGVVGARDRASLPPAGRGGIVVYCEVELSESDAATLARTIEQLKPVNVPYRLRIPRRTPPDEEETIVTEREPPPEAEASTEP
jgi:phage tail-like protein